MWRSKSKKGKTSRIDTLIGQQTQVLGDVKFSGGLHVDGLIKGNVSAEADGSSMLSLSESGTIEGEVKVPFVVLDGAVKGDVHGGEHVQLSEHAQVTGNVYYNLIEVTMGAAVNGKLVHTPEADRQAVRQAPPDSLEAPE